MAESLKFQKEVWNKITDKAKVHSLLDGGLRVALCETAERYYQQDSFDKLWEILGGLYKRPLLKIETLEEFWQPKLKEAVKDLVGKEGLENLMEVLQMKMKCQFSSSIYRRSYRSQSVSYHAGDFVHTICNWIYFQGYDTSVKDMLFYQHDWVRGYEWKIALEIKRGNQEIIDLIREAMLGDNQSILLTRKMILAVIVSGNEELLDLLLNLLYAARLQEGLRQQILESADAGSKEVLIKILKFCMEQDMFRYSSAIRALDTWTGLGYGDAKPALAKKCAALAYECLTDEEARKRYLDSEDTLEIYFAVWSIGCENMGDCDEVVNQLVDSHQKYKQVLGWYFVLHTDAVGYKMYHALRHLEERDLEMLAWVTSSLATTPRVLYYSSYSGSDTAKVKTYQNENFPAELGEQKKLFIQLKDVVKFIGNQNKVYSGNPFSFFSITLENTRALQSIFSLVACTMNQEMLEELMTLRTFMDSDLRRALYKNFLDPENQWHRIYLREALQDRSVYVKELAVKRLSESQLSTEDLDALAESLRSKSSSLRKNVMDILKKQDGELLSPMLQKMLVSKEENQIQAAIELLLEFRETLPELLEMQKESLAQLPSNLSTQTEILRKQLMNENASEEITYTVENGFGLYRPEMIDETRETYRKYLPEKPTEKGIFSKLLKKANENDLYDIKALQRFVPNRKEVEGILARMNAVFVRHADYEYETLNYDGSREKVLFGNVFGSIRIPAEFGTNAYVNKHKTLEMIPFYEEFLEAAGEYATDIQKMLGMTFLFTRGNGFYGIPYAHEMEEWYEKFLEKFPESNIYEYAYNMYRERSWQIAAIVDLLWKRFDPHELCKASLKWYRSIICLFGMENLEKNTIRRKELPNVSYYGPLQKRYPIDNKFLAFWRMRLSSCAVTDEDFIEWFRLEYAIESQLSDIGIAHGLSMEDFFRAVEMKLISRDVLTRKLLVGNNAAFMIKMLTNPNRHPAGANIYKTYPWAKEYVDQVVQRIVEVEEKRGELVTPLTEVARNIGRFEGVTYFVHLLAALGKENFFRGYEFSSDTTKRAVLSRLLKHCYPAEEDTAEKMQMYLKGTDISEKRLAEAVMYAPQWAGMAEEVLGWNGLKRGVWFFHAHINERFSAEKETEVAIYSPISAQQFNDGTFAKEWFLQSYEELGEKRFRILYQSAKYITTGSNQHRRSQLYTDAVLGRLDGEELRKEIVEKRNQEKLRCYPLIPLGEDGKAEALRRYTFIQQFQKESKQFGSQRKESEKKACNTALENLAMTMKFADVNRMIWYLESEQFEQIRPLTHPQEIEGYQIWLEIDEVGTAGLVIEKNGKRQKSMPTALKKKDAVLEIQATVKELKEQRRRGKESLEKAMVECAVFPLKELSNILKNPVLAPMIQALVWTDGEHNGFLQKQEHTFCLINVHGEVIEKNAEEELRIAHPHDLISKKEWAQFMHFLYTKQIQQPFKQVFREYYSLTEDECQEKNISRRYAGHQVQPQKTVALLKGRGWTVDYEEGLQKVYYKENLIVRMYALADWFSPADIEAPTLEVIRFFDRNTNEIVDLEKIPPILFSEAMRDMDLVVSIAHVGGVDPEASHSTVEMRVAIAAELVQLLRLTNVSFVGSHAKIQGKLNAYSVHMGSGIVHAETVGMVSILPVHSQARGRIFLPFADEDPKTAEIMSKIILLAEDGKIKDTSILSQIRR